MVVRLRVQSLSHSSGSTWCSKGVPSNLNPPASNLSAAEEHIGLLAKQSRNVT